ncbi:hypothetical protein JCM11641_002568 [Rhodosporidiobolus odoratus]
MATQDTHYTTLGITTDATSEEVRTAYLKLAKNVHPDKVLPEEKEEATRLFATLATAYSVLSDSQRRKAYDLTLPSSALVPFSAPALAPVRSPSPSAFHAPFPPRRPPSPTHSPFPSYRVPPGGYPRTPAAGPRAFDHRFEDPPLFPSSPAGDWNPFSAPSSSPYSQASPSAPRNGVDLIPPLHSLDPFAIFERVMALQHYHRPQPFPPLCPDHSHSHRHSHPHPYPHIPSYPHPLYHPGRPRTPSRRASASFNEGEKHRNGDWSQTSGQTTFEEAADGTFRYSSTSTSISVVHLIPTRLSTVDPLSTALEGIKTGSFCKTSTRMPTLLRLTAALATFTKQEGIITAHPFLRHHAPINHITTCLRHTTLHILTLPITTILINPPAFPALHLVVLHRLLIITELFVRRVLRLQACLAAEEGRRE